MKKIFELKQKLTLLVNEYRILEDTPDGQQALTGYVKQKRFAMREKFSLFTDETQREIVASSKARSVMDIAPTFDVYDNKDQPLAVLKKEFKRSLFSSTWSIYDPKMEKVLFTLGEKSSSVAIFRRLWDFIPYVGDIPFMVKFHFSIKVGDELAGEYIKTSLLRDHYALYLNENQVNKVDERVWMVMAVLLDAMQSR
jgi:uncharacterized protein YxjI